MAAGTWKIYTKAKKVIGSGNLTMATKGITLGIGVFKMALLRTSASAEILKVSIGGISAWSAISGVEISAQGGYVAGGRNLAPATGTWTTGASNKQLKFTYNTSGVIFTASLASLKNIKYCVIRASNSTAALSRLLCFVTLSTAAFSIVNPNTLTIAPAATGVFTLA